MMPKSIEVQLHLVRLRGTDSVFVIEFHRIIYYTVSSL